MATRRFYSAVIEGIEFSGIMSVEGVKLRRESSDIADLLALSQARLLIGSNSTFSRWAAFFGNMPSIWLRTERVIERPTSEEVPIVYVDDDFEAIGHEILSGCDGIEIVNQEVATGT